MDRFPDRFRWLFGAALIALLVAGGGSSLNGCTAEQRSNIGSVLTGDVEAPQDEAKRAIAGGYESLASARETVLVLYLGEFIPKDKARSARDSLKRLELQLQQADALVESGAIADALSLALQTKTAIGALVDGVKGGGGQ